MEVSVFRLFSIYICGNFFKITLLLWLLQVAHFVEGGWIQKFRPSTYRFPESEKALTDAIEAAGPSLGPLLLSMSEYLMSSFNESYQSRYLLIVLCLHSMHLGLYFAIMIKKVVMHHIVFLTLSELRSLSYAT